MMWNNTGKKNQKNKKNNNDRKLARGCVKREKNKYVFILNINGLFTKIKGERFYKWIKAISKYVLYVSDSLFTQKHNKIWSKRWVNLFYSNTKEDYEIYRVIIQK